MLSPRKIRDELEIKPGWRALQRVVNNHVEIYFVPPERNRSQLGALAKYVKNARPIGDDDWARVKEEAWTAHVRERWGEPEANK